MGMLFLIIACFFSMCSMKITLVQTAFNREKELVRFIKSLQLQLESFEGNIQYIFIDQGENSHLFLNIKNQLEFIYIKHQRCSLSYARNLGLSYANGDIICFPDDDCWYPKRLFAIIQLKFSFLGCDGYGGIVSDENGVRYNKYPTISQFLTRERHFGVSSVGMFLRFDDNLVFDENIGVGSSRGIMSGEESDYLSRYIAKGHNVLFCPDIVVYHPVDLRCRKEEYLVKTYNYAIGEGYVANKNSFSLGYKIKLIMRPIFGMIFFFIKGDIYMVKRSYAVLRGRIRGLNLTIERGRT